MQVTLKKIKFQMEIDHVLKYSTSSIIVYL